MSLFDTIANVKGPKLTSDIFTAIGNKVSTPAVAEESDNTLTGIFKRFFTPEPDGRLRFRDVVREIPGQAVRHAKVGAEFGKDVLQGTARSAGSAGLSLQNTINEALGKRAPQKQDIIKAPDEIKTFSDAFHLVLFGDEDVESLGTRVEKFPSRISGFGEAVTLDEEATEAERLEFRGKVEKRAKPFAIPAVLGLTALDFVGGGGQKKVVQAIATMDKVEDIVNLLRSQVKGLPDDLVPSLAKDLTKAKTPEAVEEVMRKAITIEKNTKKIADKRMTSGFEEGGFVTTTKKSPNTSPEVKAKIASNYNPLSNNETLNTARNLINKDVNEAIKFAKNVDAPATAESNAVSQLLIQQAQNAGKWEDAIELIEITSQRATKQGQAIQALSMWNRLSPEGILRFTQKTVDDVNKALPSAKKIKISEDFAIDITKQARKIEKMVDGEEKAIETALMIAKINDLVPPSFGRKLATFQILAQLLNPKTLIRNIGGNSAFSVLENVNDVFGAAMDSPLSILTGRRSKTLPSITTQAVGFAKGLKQGVRDAVLGIDTVGLPTRFDIPKTPVFKGSVGKAAEKTLNIVLRGPDRAAYKAAYDGSIYQQTRAAAINSGNIKKVLEPTEEMKEIAHHDGLYRTFQDENVISNLFVNLKRTLNLEQDFGLGDIIIKYPKTPGNLLARGLDYSPAGLVNTVYQASRPLMGKTFNQKEFIETFTRSLTGTGSLIGVGAMFHRLGIITGEREKDIDIRGVQRISGLGQYKINASALKRFALSGMDPESAKLQKGDTLYTYDWFQPLAIGISIGANLDQNHQDNATKGESTVGVALALIEGVASGVNTLGEQPLVQNLTRLFRAGEISEAGKDAVKQIPRSFVPTLLSQVNQFVDNTQRNTYDPNLVNEAYNAAKQRFPVFSGSLPPRISAFGEDLEVYQGGGNNLFNVFFNPSFKSNYTPTPESELVLDLFETTGQTKQAPRIIGKSVTVNGKKMKLGPKQITAMQRFVGTISRDYFNTLANNPEFNKMGDEEKVKHMSNVLSDIGSAAKIIILGDRPSKNPSTRTQVLMLNYLKGNQLLQEKIQEDVK